MEATVKKHKTVPWIFPMTAIVALFVACESKDLQKQMSHEAENRLTQTNLGKPIAAVDHVRLSTLPPGLYRLGEVRVQTEVTRSVTTPEGPQSYQTAFAARQTLTTDPRRRERFSVRPGDVEQSFRSDDPAIAELEISLAPEMKLPLTVRIGAAGAVSFEQIRWVWYCLKMKSPCEQRSYLSEGSTAKAGAIQPALYLTKKSLGTGGTDVETAIDTLTTIKDDGGFTIYLESASGPQGTGPLQRFALNYRLDPRSLPQDDLGNPSEEKLAVEPLP